MVFETTSDCYGFVIPVCLAGIVWAIFNAYLVSQVSLDKTGGDYTKINDEENGGQKVAIIAHIGKLIQNGADEFLF